MENEKILTLKNLTKNQKKDILNRVIKYLNDTKSCVAEDVTQDDEAQIEAIDLAANIADIVSFDFYGFNEE